MLAEKRHIGSFFLLTDQSIESFRSSKISFYAKIGEGCFD